MFPGSAYGNLSGEIGFGQLTCTGNEKDLTACSMTFNSTCLSGYYVSVYCSNKTIKDEGMCVSLYIYIFIFSLNVKP